MHARALLIRFAGGSVIREKTLGTRRVGELAMARHAAFTRATVSRMRNYARSVLVGAAASVASLFPIEPGTAGPRGPYIVVLGTSQDGGTPQTGTKEHPGWTDPKSRRLVACLGLVDPAKGQRWMFDATPDFPEQLQRLDVIAPVDGRPGLAGLFLTHAHMGHYTGLMHLGHEAIGARSVAVYAMPKMRAYLRNNGPWSQLVRYENIALNDLAAGETVKLSGRLSVTPFLVPHRQEFSEVVGYRIDGPDRSVLFIPDIDSWEQWDEAGTRIETLLAEVDVAYLDGTFHHDGEIPGRDMSGFPHPFIKHSMKRFSELAADQKAKIRFIHLNHTNPANWPDSAARRAVEAAGFRIAVEGERIGL